MRLKLTTMLDTATRGVHVEDGASASCAFCIFHCAFSFSSSPCRFRPRSDSRAAGRPPARLPATAGAGVRHVRIVPFAYGACSMPPRCGGCPRSWVDSSGVYRASQLAKNFEPRCSIQPSKSAGRCGWADKEDHPARGSRRAPPPRILLRLRQRPRTAPRPGMNSGVLYRTTRPPRDARSRGAGRCARAGPLARRRRACHDRVEPRQIAGRQIAR